MYHLEPAFCVASQYTNADNLPTVIRCVSSRQAGDLESMKAEGGRLD